MKLRLVDNNKYLLTHDELYVYLSSDNEELDLVDKTISKSGYLFLPGSKETRSYEDPIIGTYRKYETQEDGHQICVEDEFVHAKILDSNLTKLDAKSLIETYFGE